ncbi:AI-2E family transporter [Chitinophaga niabensis]|uniref:Predicted PurR-regulated permease PerM n=1 Tax=Chitinophaga niabensis TaxID=536979 RepID=A0A1N6JPL3_9BACT|nr:AI-2E family transporter [Chitinophaga niabensis]SIO46265.1 Predicted PurR-regulated permease PerM [Chitinophaga niabensis]
MSYLDNERLKQVVFLLILAFLGIILFKELYAFFPGFLGAVTLYVLSRKWMFRLVEQRKWGRSWAATLIMVLSFLIILLPIGGLVNMLTSKVTYAITHSSELIKGLEKFNQQLQQSLGVNLMTEARLQKIQETITAVLPGFVGATFNTLTAIAIMYFILYFMLVNAREMEEALYEYIPLKDENVELLGKEMKNMVVSNAIGIPLIALIQGIVSLIGYLIFGVPEPVFWFVVTSFTAMLPIIGAAAVYVPMGVFLLSSGQTWQGVAILIYGFGAVGTSDNLFRMMLAKKIGDVHPLITIFGVIIGVSLFGFIGLIFGPLLISLFIVLLKIYSNEYLVKKREVKIVKTAHAKEKQMKKSGD